MEEKEAKIPFLRNIDAVGADGEPLKSDSFETFPECPSEKVNFRTLVNADRLETYDLVLPRSAVDHVKSMYDNSLIGYFFGQTLAFPVVYGYVNKAWAEFGFQKIITNDDGVFLFKFASKTGAEQVLENSPWMINNTPIILNKWSPYFSLKKDEVTKVPVWVKLHGVPLVAYSEDGLSLIATQIGKPIMLDAFTSSLCVESWESIGFARALVEISSDTELKQQVVMAVPVEEGIGYTKEIIRVEYEWMPPHCVYCKIFGHDEGAHINLKVRSQDCKEVFFRIKRSTQLKKLMYAYCDRRSVELDAFAFMFDGLRLRGEQTPDELEMEDGDEIDAMHTMCHPRWQSKVPNGDLWM